MTSVRQVRALRGAVTASAATFVALLSHLLGGGVMPGWAGIAVPLALALPLGVLLSARRLSAWRLSASVVVSQLLFHVLFVLGTPSSALPAAVSGHAHHSVEPAVVSVASVPHVAHILTADPWMWASHGVAALVTIVLLHRGERLLLGLRELAERIGAWALRRLLPAIVVPNRRPAARLAGPGWTTGPLSSQAELTPLWRRGPPLSHAI